MKKEILISVVCSLAALPFAGFAQQNNSGVVDYQVTMQRRGPGGGGNQDNDDAGPSVFTMNRVLTFTADAGKLASAGFQGQRPAARRGGGNSGDRQAGRNGGNAGGRSSFAGRGGGEEYIDFKDKQYLRAFKRGDNDTTFYTAEAFRPAENFQSSTKTKKIAGYTCQAATAQMRNATYTIWYTKDIPVNYSPVNGLVPPGGGFVLGIQSDRMEYKATKVQLKPVAEAEVQIQAPSHELSQDEVQAMRSQMMDRMRRGRQGNRQQP